MKLNYLKELNAFKEWMAFHEMPPNAVLLWHTLMMLNNTARWKPTFNAPNTIIRNLSGLTSQRIIESRKILMENELIHYEPGVKNKAAMYQMKSLVFYFEKLAQTSREQWELRNKVPNPVQFGYQPRDILKVKEKDKQNRGEGRANEQNAYTVYEQNFGIIKPIVRESFLAWCDDLGDEIVIEAIKLAAEKGGRTYSYLEAILKEWQQAGITTLEQAENYQLQKNKSQSTQFFVTNKSKNRAVLDEIRRELKS
ncbi:hypothetical protein GCM10011351_31560 [Paraliobacillus quinghaiensis]|uniref:DnaB/C C-terminal domain-containing protein n=1 Tax=Paraliobacillus quinghaiensis TaxID=470815 RepID=A0A917TY21_9BACI|nr:hypothetical protein GCM10011351_31560 [Paraliobacillus quinghaiensis]